MTELIDGTIYAKEEKPQQCDLCGKIGELRPYGPGGACVCFECGMLDEKEAERQLGRRLKASEGNYQFLKRMGFDF